MILIMKAFHSILSLSNKEVVEMEQWLGLNEKVAIVTGGSSGIGCQIVLSLLEQGAYVYNADLNDQTLENSNYRFIKTDVSNYENVVSSFHTILEERSKIDILVNNAGINLPRMLVDVNGEKPQYEINEPDLDLMFNVNLKGPVFFAQEVSKYFVQHDGGVIVNVASEAGQEGSEGQSIYAATKAALIGFTRSWAKELGKHNIRVVAIAPGILEETGLRTPAYEEALAYTRNIQHYGDR